MLRFLRRSGITTMKSLDRVLKKETLENWIRYVVLSERKFTTDKRDKQNAVAKNKLKHISSQTRKCSAS